MPQESQYGAAQPIVDVAKKAYNLAKGLMGNSDEKPKAPAPSPAPDPWREQKVREANESFKKSAEEAKKPASPAKPVKKVPSYKEGTDRVPKTGLAKLHKGEAVLNKEDADEYRKNKMAKPSNLSKGLSKSKKSSGKKGGKKHKIRHMHIETADNGGFNVRHMHEQGDPGSEPIPDTTHALSSPDELLSHVQGQFGGQMPAPAAGPGGPGGPAPAGAM